MIHFFLSKFAQIGAPNPDKGSTGCYLCHVPQELNKSVCCVLVMRELFNSSSMVVHITFVIHKIAALSKLGEATRFYSTQINSVFECRGS